MAPRSLTDAEQRGWGRGWPSCDARDHTVWARGGGVQVPVREEIAPIVSWLLEQTAAVHGYTLHQEQCGGYVCRGMRLLSGGESDTPSNHSWALAIDVNWNQNGFGHGTAHDIPPAVVELWEAHGFNWGGHWTDQSPDYMHFEFNGTPADAGLIAYAIAGGSAPQPAPVPEEDDDVQYVLINPDEEFHAGEFRGLDPTFLATIGRDGKLGPVAWHVTTKDRDRLIARGDVQGPLTRPLVEFRTMILRPLPPD
jgi:hypothetical protein